MSKPTTSLLSLSSASLTLESFWAATMAQDVAALSTEDVARAHEVVCGVLADAMVTGRTPTEYEWRSLSALQAERGLRASVAPRPSAPVAGPVLVHYETSAGDGPGALPLRLSLPVLCF